jgi:hypothetical protein
MAEHETDTSKLTPLARFYHLTARKGAPTVLLGALTLACAFVLAYDGFYHKHEKVEVANSFGFYAYYGFACFTFIIFAALLLREIIRRREDYYGDQDINAEETPEHMLERKSHDGL